MSDPSTYHLFPYAKLPLDHLARSLSSPLSGRRPALMVAWNTIKPDQPDSIGAFISNAQVLCMETPLFGRTHWQFDGSSDPERVYYRLALHDPSVLYGGFRIDGDRERRADMFEKLGINVSPWRKHTSTGHILYALQVPGDTSLKGTNILEAAIWTLYELKRHTSRPIVVSLHPDCFNESWAASRLAQLSRELDGLRYACHLLGVRILQKDEKTSDFFEGAHCCITHTSGTSFDALCAGVPCITLDRGSFQYPITAHDPARVENPLILPRREWWAKLAHIQYSWAEISRGEHVETVLSLLK